MPCGTAGRFWANDKDARAAKESDPKSIEKQGNPCVGDPANFHVERIIERLSRWGYREQSVFEDTLNISVDNGVVFAL